MAIIKCPGCQQEISDKSSKCIHCGREMQVGTSSKKFCVDCSKEIPLGLKECPFCGCPVEVGATEKLDASLGKKKGKGKKTLLIITVILILVVSVGLFANYMGLLLDENERLAYQNAVDLQSMMKDPESFRLYDEMYLINKLNDDGSLACTYTIFEYGGTNSYGAVITDQAIFKGREYIMDYSEELDESDIEYEAKTRVKLDMFSYQVSLLTDENSETDWQTIEIDTDKIKNRMGLFN